MINLKGGVGKTQTVVAIAEFLAMQHKKKVLVIDLDPQTNATMTLITQDAWKDKNEKGETIFQMFKDRLDNTSKFNIKNSIMQKVSNVNDGIPNLDLLPSSLDLVGIQDELSQITTGRFHLFSPVMILKRSISPVLQDYDYVLIDCPPNLGIITLNGLYISDFYVIPTIPDILPTFGIPQIMSRISDFSRESDLTINPSGIIISMYRKQSTTHKTMMESLKNRAQSGEYPPVYDTVIPLTVRTADAADVSSVSATLKQKYGYVTMFDVYDKLTNEFLERIR